MQIICSSILEFREYDDKRIICQVKITPKGLPYGDDRARTPPNFHWLDADDWCSFDAALRLIATDLSKECEYDLNEEFDIGATARMHVKQSSTPIKTLLKCLGHKRSTADAPIWALECAIELKEKAWEIPKLGDLSGTNESAEFEIFSSQESLSCEQVPESSFLESVESASVMYVPSPIKSQTSDLDDAANVPKQKRYSPTISSKVKLSYTPSPIKKKSHSADSHNEDRYSPALDGDADQPKYKPSPIKKQTHSVADSPNEDRYSPVVSTEVDQPKYKPSPINIRSRSGRKIDENIFTDSSEEDNKPAQSINEAKRIKKNKTKNDEANEEDDAAIGQKKSMKSSSKFSESSSSKLSDKAQQREKEYRQSRKLKEAVAEEKRSRHKKSSRVEDCKYVEDTERKLDGESKKSGRNDNDDTTRKLDGDSKKIKKKTQPELADILEKSKTKDLSPTRRSARSPVKPKRLINEMGHQKINKFTIPKKKPSNRELFGSGDENDDFNEATPIKNAPKTEAHHHQTSITKKRKRSDKTDWTQEKSTINKWLSKKPIESPDCIKTSKPRTHSKERSSRHKPLKIETHSKESKSKHENLVIPKPNPYPTQEEIDRIKKEEKERIETNKRMEEMLENYMREQKPKEVEILSLNNMSSEEILKTFVDHREKLDGIFAQFRKRPNVNHYNGINHYTVINLIETDKEQQMMLKLGEVYEKDAEGTSLYTKLFTNAMMPEWLVNIFKDKYKLSYDEAVTQLKAQADYKEYIDSLQDD